MDDSGGRRYIHSVMNQMVFGEIPAGFAGYDDSLAVILPIPYEKTTSYLKGTAEGPDAILKASSQIELFDEKLKKEPFRIGIHTLPPFPTSSHSAALLAEIEQEAFSHLARGKLLVVLGGEHTITAGAVKAARRVFPHIGVLQIDAHADLRASYQEDPYSHACAMRLLLGIVPLYQLGIRSLTQEEYLLIEEGRTTTLFAHELSPQTLDAFLSRLPPDLYVTIDMDGFDPSVVPGVGTPEPGGLDWKTVDSLLEKVVSSCRIRAFDLVELRPLPQEARSEITAARLLYRLLGYIGLTRGLL
jgi:agmatinase